MLVGGVDYTDALRKSGLVKYVRTGGDYLEISAEAHQQLLDWLRKHPEIWIGTFQQIMDYASARTR